MTKQEALEILDWIPTKGDEVDAMEMAIEALHNDIVRCKDCKHRSKSGLCNMWSVFGTVTTDDEMYCSYGERGEENGN